ncbi:hypothetical protein GCM10027294_22440 [Marinactinospora endophytica]
MADEPEIVVSGRGFTARFDGERLRLVRGRNTWTVPVRAMRLVTVDADTTVRIGLSGDGRAARHGLGAEIVLSCRSANAAAAFAGSLQRALRARGTVADGHAPVEVETRERATDPRHRRRARVAGAVAVYVALLVALGAFSGDPGTAWLVLGPISWTGPAGVGLVWFCWVWLVRDLVVLRRRGVTVAGHCDRVTRAFGGNVLYTPVLSYRTVEGRSLSQVRSRGFASASMWLEGSGPVDVTYDPLDPARASIPLSRTHLGWTVFMVVLGVVLILVWVIGVTFVLLA